MQKFYVNNKTESEIQLKWNLPLRNDVPAEMLEYRLVCNLTGRLIEGKSKLIIVFGLIRVVLMQFAFKNPSFYCMYMSQLCNLSVSLFVSACLFVFLSISLHVTSLSLNISDFVSDFCTKL